MANFEIFPIGTKVETTDKDGYFVLTACGYIAKHLGEGHAIIKGFDGSFYSTVGNRRIYAVKEMP